jgi:mitogen-activated protein kinase kinase
MLPIFWHQLTGKQAIVDGDPPNLPEEGFSSSARDFVKRCLHKVPELRPTYAELLLHPWLTYLDMVPISEEDEEMADTNAETSYTGGVGANKVMGGGRGTEDDEVAAWVKSAIERKKSGAMKFSEKPALHAAPLDATKAAANPGQ